jgi:hypothetical protein
MPISSSLRIFDVSVLNTPFSVTDRYQVFEIHMGDLNVDVIGDHTYDLSYRMSPPVFGDLFSLNIVGIRWLYALNNVTFSIIFPKPFDPSTIKLFGGPYGNTSLTTNCSYECLDGTISGRCSM